MTKKKILMTYMESGMGHITSIRSISDNLKKYYGNNFEIIDSYIMQEDKNTTLKKFEKFIINQTKNTNKIRGYGTTVFWLIKFLGGVKFMRLLHRTLFRKAVNETLNVFKKYSPDVIISTHYYMTFCALEYRKKINKKLKVITYNPDNNVHTWWDNREHLFLVNNKNAYIEAIGKRKFNPSLVEQVFYTARDEIINANLTKNEYREKLNIPRDKFCVIIADGAYACAKCKRVTNKLLNTKFPLTIITVAGKNNKLYDKYTYLIDHNRINSNITLIVLPFTKNIYEYYKSADIFVTKAGPNAILDSVFMETPIIVDYYAHPIEKATTKLFIDELHVGKKIFNPKKIRLQIEEWIQDPTELISLQQNAKQLDKNANGGKECSDLIYNNISTPTITETDNDYTNRLYELASLKLYDTYTTPINLMSAKNNISYDKIPRNNIFMYLYEALISSILKTISPVINHLVYKIKIYGKKNIKGIKSAITLSNHVHYLDCLWNKQAVGNRRLYITGAPHNFKKGLFGATLQAGGFIPIANTFSESKNFAEYISKQLRKGSYIHFYPEQSLWRNYEQSRPLKKGAFYYASENNVPIIPIIICFRKSVLKNHKNVSVFICKPIYPNDKLSKRENCLRMQKLAQKFYYDTIINFYKYNREKYSMENTSIKNRE